MISRSRHMALHPACGAMNADDLVATKRLLAKHPNGVVYGLQIGFPTAYRIGEHFSAQTQ